MTPFKNKLNKFLILFVLTIIVLQASSQNKIDADYRVFSKEFHRQLQRFEQKNRAEKRANLPLKYIKLPSWFTLLQNDSAKKLLFFGISDPDMDSAAAFSQAVMRAKGIMLMLLYGRVICTTHSFIESYPHISLNYKRFVVYNRILSDDTICRLGFKLVHKAILSSGEVIVALSNDNEHAHSEVCSPLRLLVDHYVEMWSKNDIEKVQTRIHWHLVRDSSGFVRGDQYDVYDFPPSFSWESKYNGYDKTSDSLRQNMFYYLKESEKSDDTASIRYSALKGLWCAYIHAVINKLMLDVYNTEMKTHLKSLSNFYSDKIISFTQTIDLMETMPLFSKISIKNNHLSIKSLHP